MNAICREIFVGSKLSFSSTIADAWLAWGFQVNFMYKLVL